MNNDIDDAVLQLLKKLFTSKTCVLYVFGNLYASTYTGLAIR
jgi:hypothetical protein